MNDMELATLFRKQALMQERFVIPDETISPDNLRRAAEVLDPHPEADVKKRNMELAIQLCGSHKKAAPFLGIGLRTISLRLRRYKDEQAQDLHQCVAHAGQ